VATIAAAIRFTVISGQVRAFDASPAQHDQRAGREHGVQPGGSGDQPEQRRGDAERKVQACGVGAGAVPRLSDVVSDMAGVAEISVALKLALPPLAD